MTVWAVGLLACVTAAGQRTALGTAAPGAAARLHLGGTGLALLCVLQLVVCAAGQAPATEAVGRFGAERVLTGGLALLVAGQLALAAAHGTAPAALSRVAAGGGDALVFAAVPRLAAARFPVRRAPLIARGTALSGAAGTLAGTLLLAALLPVYGWRTAFTGTALAATGVLALALVVPRERGHVLEPPRAERAPAGVLALALSRAWREPGTRLGVWVHFTAQCPATVFLLLWGVPFLTGAEHRPPAEAGLLLSVVVASSVPLGLLYGQLVARHRGARMPLALGTVAATAAVWTAVLALGRPAPLWTLVLLCVVLGACGPAAATGVDFARPANPPERMAAVSGLVALGGFTASLAALTATGVLLDVSGGDWRLALCAVPALQLVGTARILRLRRAVARRERERLPAGRIHAVHTVALRGIA